MSLTDSHITFPLGDIAADTTVVAASDDPAGAIIALGETPFHPVDHTWPDQPGDTGVLRAGAGTFDVVQTQMGAVGEDGTIVVGTDIPVRRGTPRWTWLVVHRLSADVVPAELAIDAAVHAAVDADRRASLSRGHTACHLASLALDAAVADLWRKDPGADALGVPDFEGRANQTSFIHPDGSVDEYRLGKSLRKAGFDTEGFAATIAEREASVNARLEAWVATAAASRIDTDGELITDRRRWVCTLPAGTAEIPCGGTHVASLAEFAGIQVALELTDPQTLVMRTDVTPA